ncbi:hypothetical protein, conserved [Eimeria necatrix]|uniref:Uncharacterized protein n=1 Tax=Eimeria necatrix TaxID=51315 RepID=U6MER8_9EIME|nr:hypothetical protein, conserved [Eimeria necatrix]CDJ62737.1 hypothetical protein, conserved [Eimeria necatrix]
MLQQMLPRFNPKATCVEELFCLDDLVPLQLLQDGSAQTGTAAAPVLLLLQQQQLDPQQQQQQQRQLAHWGEFIAAAAKHAALQKQIGAGSHLSKQLTLQQLARLLKILKFLCLLLKKQRRSFSSQQDLARQLRVGPEPPGHAVAAWLQTEFLKKGFDEKYSMPKEYQTKVLMTIAWVCCALSADFKFDFTTLLEVEFNNERTAKAAASAAAAAVLSFVCSFMEYQLSFPSPLVQLESASDLSMSLQSVFEEKRKRRR